MLKWFSHQSSVFTSSKIDHPNLCNILQKYLYMSSPDHKHQTHFAQLQFSSQGFLNLHTKNQQIKTEW